MARKTTLAIDGERFLINGAPTYAGRTFRGWPIEGLLLNVRAVQALFDDLNPETRDLWAYPDTGVWDPERNLNEFLAVLPEWREAGLLAVTVNLQGGSPEGYSRPTPEKQRLGASTSGSRFDQAHRCHDCARALTC